MAYLPMTQEIIKFMNKEFDKDDIVTYQMLITLFGNLFANEKEFLNDPGDRMGLSHFVESFLRQNDIQSIVTIKDLNLIFNSNTQYDIYDKELYKVFFTLIYEELSSNDPSISYKIKEAIFNLIHLIEESVNQIEEKDESIEEKKYEPELFTEEIKESFSQPVNINNHRNKFIAHVSNKKSEVKDNAKNNKIESFKRDSDNFIIHNKFYLSEYIKVKQLIPYQCDVCGLVEWQNQPLKLELDSLDGVYSNLNLGSLRFLCPNCYSQIGHY